MPNCWKTTIINLSASFEELNRPLCGRFAFGATETIDVSALLQTGIAFFSDERWSGLCL
jgi:hypothetical protein